MSHSASPTSIKLFSGRYFDFADLPGSPIMIEDIAHSLSLLNRFNGHSKDAYSVAQHSVVGSLHCEPELAFKFLMHDAHEAYVGDMTSPLQKMVLDFKPFAKTVQIEVLSRFGLTLEDMPSILHVDLNMLATEQRDVMDALGDYWPATLGRVMYDRKIRPWDARMAEKMFLTRFAQLTGRAPTA